MDEGDHVAQGGVVAQGQAVVAFDVVGGSDGGEGLGLLHGVDAEVGFEVEVEVEQVGGVAGLFGHDRQHLLLHPVPDRRVGAASTPSPVGAVGGASATGAAAVGAVAVKPGARSWTKAMTWRRVG